MINDYTGLVSKLPTADLVSIHNSLMPEKKQVNRFADRAAAEKRTLKELESHTPSCRDLCKVVSENSKEIVKSFDEATETQVQRHNPPAKGGQAAASNPPAKQSKPKKEKAPKEKKEPKGPRGNRHKGSIIYKVSSEKLRDGSRRKKSYDAVKDGMTYDECLAAGANKSDMSVMLRNSNIRAELPK